MSSLAVPSPADRRARHPARHRYRSLNPQLGDALSAREIEVMWGVAEGLSNKEIGSRLHRSQHTAKFHLDNALRKLGTGSRTRAAVIFVLARPAQAALRALTTEVA